ncbi:MAG TPA: TonB-dependent receptor [Verrucomicrobiae bacterium]|nr:TonB-dependent receptor [Verrucomicrobiae bacterium]
MARDVLSTDQKALRINLDAKRYGTFAEIGAGQEVARWFFRVGGASGTVAKTISAYDMAVSDAIYGPAERYVSRQRLRSMLEYEYALAVQRLEKARGDRTAFFAFANTVATSSYTRREDGHGWMGIRFQTEPHSPPSEIVIHVRMLDRESARQQEALGIIGVNFIFGTFYHHSDPAALIRSLLDNLTWERVEVDMIRFSGPAFDGVDNRLMALQLVKQDLTEAAMFSGTGEAAQWGEVLYKKPVLVQRGSFRPLTTPMLDMLQRSQEQFSREPSLEGETPIVILEITLRQLQVGDEIDHADFLERVDALSALGLPVLLSNFLRYHRLVAYLSRYTQKPIGLPLGLVRLRDIFDEKFYTGMPGGVLESFGQLFRNGVKLFVYPSLDRDGKLTTLQNIEVPPHLTHLLQHLIANRMIVGIENYDPSVLGVYSGDVLKLIQANDPSWDKHVPPAIADVIKAKRLFGFRG